MNKQEEQSKKLKFIFNSPNKQKDFIKTLSNICAEKIAKQYNMIHT